MRQARGRSLSSSATFRRCRSVMVSKSVPLGKYWRRRPLVFSLLPRCQGECGSAKKMRSPVVRSIPDNGRPLMNGLHRRGLFQRPLAVTAPATLVPVGAPGPQRLLIGRYHKTPINRLVNRLSAHVPPRTPGPAPSKPAADLGRGPMLVELAGHRLAQVLIDVEPARFWSAPTQVGLAMGIPGLVAAIGLAVAGNLPIYGLVALPDPRGDRLHRLTGRESVGNLDAVVLGEITTADGLPKPTAGRYVLAVSTFPSPARRAVPRRLLMGILGTAKVHSVPGHWLWGAAGRGPGNDRVRPSGHNFRLRTHDRTRSGHETRFRFAFATFTILS